MPPEPSGPAPTFPMPWNANEKIPSSTTGKRNVKKMVSPWRKCTRVS